MADDEDRGRSPLALGPLRPVALEHTFDLLRTTWRGFDTPRPGQPPLSEESLSLLAEPLPERGVGPVRALTEAEALLDQSLAQSRPRFFGYVGSSGLEVAVLAQALAASHDVNLASTAAAADLVEQQTVRWVAEFLGFGGHDGVVTSGGMLSNLTALAAARERALPGSREHGTDARGTVYTSAEAHSSVLRAVELLGLGSQALRSVPIDAQRRMDPVALDGMIQADLAAGRVPVAVVATAGTTLTGAVDPLAAIAEVTERHGVWLHVDGAYGLPAAATDVARDLFAGLDRVDSAGVDAHKWLFVPKACAVLLVRDPAALRAAFGHAAAYMVDEDDNPVNRTLEYSRPFRSLKLWAAFRAHGADALRQAVESDLLLARLLADRVRAEPTLELLVEPQLSIVPFRVVPRPGEGGAAADARNAEVVRRLQRDADVYVTSAVVDGRTCLRPCLTNFRTTAADVHALVDAVLAAATQAE